MKYYSFITRCLQTCVAFSALGGSAYSLVWLEQQRAAAPLPSQSCWAETAPLVVVDAGHGGHDGGAVANGVIEKNLSLDIANRLKKELQAAGLRVVMSRTDDSFLSLDERAALASTHQAAAFVSVHLNTDGAGSGAEGIETYFAESHALSARQLAPAGSSQRHAEGSSAEFASAVQHLVCTATKAENRGTKARDYAVVARAVCPAILVECGFITSPSESARLKQTDYRDKIANGIARGVALFLQRQAFQVAASR